VTLVGAAALASIAEAALRDEPVDDAEIAHEIAPCFVEDTARTDTIVLACTHYPLLLDRMDRLAPWPVDWIDPAPAIARRTAELMGAPGGTGAGRARIIFTSGKPPSEGLARALNPYFRDLQAA
jgi:glutamate racemase